MNISPRTTPLSPEDLAVLDAYWRAANYLAVGQIYLLDNPLLDQELSVEHIKPRLLGHWGTTPGLNLIYAHLNRAITDRDLDLVHVTGPGHGGPATVACTWLDGVYSEVYPDVSLDEAGMRRLFKQFSFPGGIPSHVAPETPGSLHEGGELGYTLSHAYGAAFDNPQLIVAAIVGDGEAETGPLATGWHGNKFLDPVHDGAVLPILHLNGYKIANPTVLGRLPHQELDSLLRGYGHLPVYVEGDEPAAVHQAFAGALDACLDAIADIQDKARSEEGEAERPLWPMIVLRTPKGWTGPSTVDGKQVEGTWRAHQVPLDGTRDNPDHLRMLADWMNSYGPRELFTPEGAPRPELLRFVPRGDRRLGANPHANGGRLTRSLPLPDVREFAVDVDKRGAVLHEPTRVLGSLLAEVMRRTEKTRDFRVVGPDETDSNRLGALFQASGKAWQEELSEADWDATLSRSGRVVEMLSEHNCQGWLEGYLLTGRHGLFSSYEAFIHIVSSMVNQHAKWLKVTRDLPWRLPIPSLNYLLTSHVWRQDHNGFSHQDPGFIDHVLNKGPEVARVWLPADTNTLLAVGREVLSSRDRINVITAGKQPTFDWLSAEEAVAHAQRGISVWDWAGTHTDRHPDVVMAAAGDVPTTEVMAAVSLLREHLPDLAVRVVNVVNLTRLLPDHRHSDGLDDTTYKAMFTEDKPVVFGFHGYPWLIHRLAYCRPGHENLHVRGYKEEGSTTTPFDMVVRNDLDRYRLVMDVIDRVPGLPLRAVCVRQLMEDIRARHRTYICRHGEDLPEVREWAWSD